MQLFIKLILTKVYITCERFLVLFSLKEFLRPHHHRYHFLAHLIFSFSFSTISTALCPLFTHLPPVMLYKKLFVSKPMQKCKKFSHSVKAVHLWFTKTTTELFFSKKNRGHNMADFGKIFGLKIPATKILRCSIQFYFRDQCQNWTGPGLAPLPTDARGQTVSQ